MRAIRGNIEKGLTALVMASSGQGAWPFSRNGAGESWYDYSSIIQLQMLGQIMKDFEMGKQSLNVLIMKCWVWSYKSFRGIWCSKGLPFLLSLTRLFFIIL